MTVLVSIAVPVWNTAPFLGKTLAAIQGQTYRHWECLIVDDGSTDASPEIAREFTRADSRFKFFRNERNNGVVFTRNRCIQEALGKFLAVNDSDDISHPERLERQVGFLLAHPETELVATGCNLIDGTGRKIGSFSPGSSRGLRWKMLFQNQIIHSTVMGKTEAFRKAGGYREPYATAEDYELWLRMLETMRCGFLPAALVDYRQHGAGLTATRSVIQKEAAVRCREEAACCILGNRSRAELLRELFAETEHSTFAPRIDLLRLLMDLRTAILTSADPGDLPALRRASAESLFHFTRWGTGPAGVRAVLTALFDNPSLLLPAFRRLVARNLRGSGARQPHDQG